MKKLISILVIFICFSIYNIHAQAISSVTKHINLKSYKVNDLVSLDGVIYKCINITITTPPSIDWVLTASGDMLKNDYDPLNISQQLLGITASQTITNKIIDSDNNTVQNIGLTEFDIDTKDSFSLMQGMTLESPFVDVNSDGVTISLTIEKQGGGDLRAIFSDGYYPWDTTPADAIILTEGSDSSHQENFIYFLQSTKLLTVSTVGFPSTEHIPVARVICQSAVSLQIDGPIKLHVYVDHTVNGDNMGHLSHFNHWIRLQPATWWSGVDLTPTITTQPAGVDNIDISTSSGIVLQLHDHSYPAFDTSISSDIYVVNKFGANYTKITDLNLANEDDAGNVISNNKWINLVIWGVVNESETDSKLFVNLPSSFHSSESAAIIDVEAYSNYLMPRNFIGTAFLISKLTFKYTTGSSGTWTLVENKDLRLGGAVGGGGVGQVEFSDNVFKIFNNVDNTKAIIFSASPISTGNERTIFMPDFDISLGLLANVNSNNDFFGDTSFQAPVTMNEEMTFGVGFGIDLNNGFLTNVDKISGSTALTGVAVLLNSQIGKYYNMASANSGTTYTFSNQVIGGWAKSLINTLTEPTVTGAFPVDGALWVSGVDMYLVIYHNGTRTEYFLLKI